LKKRIATWPIATSGIILILALQLGYDQAATDFREDQHSWIVNYSEPLVPSAEALNFLSLGNKPLIADILWLQTVQYFGSGSPYGKYKALGPMLDRITEVDPKFEYPYRFGLVVLPYMDQIDWAVKIGERAQEYLPDNGTLSFFYASDHLLYTKDYQKAAELFDKASQDPKAPTAAKSLAAVALSKVRLNINDRLIAREYWKIVEQSATNSDDKERAARWELQMDLVYNLEQIIAKYHNDLGSFPQDFQEMLNKGYISSIPVSPVDRVLSIDQNSGAVLFDQVKSDN